MFTPNCKMYLYLSTYLMTITVVYLQSTVDYETLIYRSKLSSKSTSNYNNISYPTSTQDYNSTPYSTSSLNYNSKQHTTGIPEDSSTPYSTSTLDYYSTPNSTNTQNYFRTPYSTRTPEDSNSKPHSSSTLDDSSKPHSTSNLDDSSKPHSTSTLDDSSKPHSTSTIDDSSKPHSTSTLDDSSKPHSTSTLDDSSKPHSTSTLDDSSKPHSTSTLDDSSKPHSTSTLDDSSKPHSTSTLDDSSKPLSILDPESYSSYDYFYRGISLDSSFEEYLENVFYNGTDDITPVIQEALNLCPQMQFCTMTQADGFDNSLKVSGKDEANGNFSGLTLNTTSMSSNCCTKCSCLPSCVATKNCCSDAFDFQQSFLNDTSCRSAAYSLRSNLQTTDVDSGIESITYDTIVDCDMDGHLEIRQSLFDDVVRVSVEDKLYLSKNCALRHGETDLVRWRLIATNCGVDLYSLPLQGYEFETYVLKHCTVFSMPPATLNVEPFMCHSRDRVIKYCNETGLWDFWLYSSDVDILCFEFKENYVYDEDGRVYRNIFCLMCNKPRGYTLPLTCPSRRQQEVPNLRRSYDLLLDVRADDKIDENSIVDNENSCNAILVFDHLEGSCRELLCPFQRLPQNGACLKREFEARYRVFPVIIKIELFASFSVNTLDTFKNMVLRQLLQEFNLASNSTVLLQKTSLSAFAPQVTNNVKFLLLTVNLRSSETVDDEWIIDFLDNFTQSNDTRIFIGNIKTPVKVSPMTEVIGERKYVLEERSRLKETLLLSIETPCSECYIVSIGKLTCPYIRLEKAEYCKILSKYGSTLSTCLSAGVGGYFTVEQVVKNGGDITEILYICWKNYKTWAEQWKENYEMSASIRTKPLLSVVVFLVVACKFLY